MLKKLAIALSLAALPILALTACGTADSQGSPPTNGSTTPSDSSAQTENSSGFACPTATFVSSIIAKEMALNPSGGCAFVNADYMTSGNAIISETVVFEELHGVSLSELRKASEMSAYPATSVDGIGNEAFLLDYPGAVVRFAFTSANGKVRYVDISYLDQTGITAREGSVSENLVRRLIHETGFAQ